MKAVWAIKRFEIIGRIMEEAGWKRGARWPAWQPPDALFGITQPRRESRIHEQPNERARGTRRWVYTSDGIRHARGTRSVHVSSALWFALPIFRESCRVAVRHLFIQSPYEAKSSEDEKKKKSTSNVASNFSFFFSSLRVFFLFFFLPP